VRPLDGIGEHLRDQLTRLRLSRRFLVRLLDLLAALLLTLLQDGRGIHAEISGDQRQHDRPDPDAAGAFEANATTVLDVAALATQTHVALLTNPDRQPHASYAYRLVPIRVMMPVCSCRRVFY
jgi:hypothetical protein